MDSDSSGDEQDSFTTTNVLLGYASQEETDDTISHLGGLPSWLQSRPSSASLARCLICNDLMPLLLQLHADLPDRFPGHDRRLHIFSCRRKTCRRKTGSVRVLRSTRVDPAQAAASTKLGEATKPEPGKPEPAKQSFLGNDLFGGSRPALGASQNKNPFAMGASAAQAAGAGANPFSLGSMGEIASKAPQKVPEVSNSTSASKAASNDLSSTFAAKARISAPDTKPPIAPPHEPWPAESDLPRALKPYPQFFLDADYEALGDGPPAPEQKVQVMDIDEEEGGASSSNAKDTVDDGTADMTLDKTFQKFSDRLWHNPEQVLRYEFGGKPLLYSDTDAVGKMLGPHQGHHVQDKGGKKVATGIGAGGGGSGMPGCKGCGAQRVFEVQLTPHAIVELEVEEENVLEGMEWGTVIVGVCSKDCTRVQAGEVEYAEEWAGVQWEESKK